MTYDTMKFGSPISFEFVLEKKTIITIEGHLNSVFRGNDGVLYFVHYHPSRSGGKVSAHDLKTGKKLWETILTAVGPIGHSAYTNQIAMNIQQKDLITIQGREAYGDYTEILDSKTGTLLANKLYREKYAPIK